MKVLFSAGDLSGDLHAARVASILKKRNPGLEIIALGGPSLKKIADVFLGDLVGEGVVGFWEPLKKLPRFWHFLKDVVEPALKKYRPDAVVPVDFYGFNRFVAAAAGRAGCPVLYFISPQVWASRPGRIEVLKRWVKKMLVIFPFEEKLYADRGVPAAFVGHPLLDVLPEVPEGGEPPRLEPVVGLLPGSRPDEVRRHLPLFLKTAEILSRGKPGMRFVLFAAPSLSNDFYDALLAPAGRLPYLLEMVRDEDYQWRRGIDLALTASGTATLENALLGVPMVVVYKMSWPTYRLARALIRVPHVSMANILAGKSLVPELIQSDATPENLAGACRPLLENPKERRRVREELLALRKKLGGPGAAERAASEILSAVPSPA